MYFEVLILKCILGSLLLGSLYLVFLLYFGVGAWALLFGCWGGLGLVGHHLLLDVLDALGGLHWRDCSLDAALGSNGAHVNLGGV